MKTPNTDALLPCPIKVTVNRDYGDCGNREGGCSGWESVEVIATDGKRTESAKQSSCFGTSEVECFEEVINKWNTRTPKPSVTSEVIELCKLVLQPYNGDPEAPSWSDIQDKAQAILTAFHVSRKE